MFEQFAATAQHAVLDARQEAARAGQDKVRAEHLLLGLLSEPGTAADAMTAAGIDAADLRARLPRGADGPPDLDGEALATLGIDLDAVRRATDAAFGRGSLDRVPVPGRHRPFAEDAVQSLSGAVKSAHKSGQRRISSGHLLLGILDQKANGAISVLAAAGVDVPALRADVARRVAAGAD